jgi:hypothetical protein
MNKLPSKIYPQFIVAFESVVTKAQKEISDIEKLQKPYNIVSECLSKANIPNDINIKMSSGYLSVSAFGTKEDRLADFKHLCVDIGQALHSAGLREHPEATFDIGGYHCRATWSWWINLSPKECAWVIFNLDIPSNGMVDVEVEASARTITTVDYKIIQR